MLRFLCFALQTEYARYENGHYSYRIHRSPLCEYMINFIHKLKHLPEKYMMNSVLENFTILQVRLSTVLAGAWKRVKPHAGVRCCHSKQIAFYSSASN